MQKILCFGTGGIAAAIAAATYFQIEGFPPYRTLLIIGLLVVGSLGLAFASNKIVNNPVQS